MNNEDVKKIRVGDKITDSSGTQYDVIGRVINDNGDITIIVKFESSVTVKDIMHSSSEKWEVPEQYHDCAFWPFPHDEICDHFPSSSKIEKPKLLYPDGMSCCVCKQHNIYAEPNLDDGRYACHSCRESRSYLI